MVNSVKKLLIILMVLFTCFNHETLNVGATNSYTINGVSVQYYDFGSAPNQCWVYANNIFTKIWGVGITGQISQNNLLDGLDTEAKRLNLENLKTYIGYAKLGSAIRLTSYEGLYSAYDFVGHSQVLVQKDDYGFTILEGGMSCPGSRREHYYTWEEYLRVWSAPNYHYIKYIVCPDTVAVMDIDQEKETALLETLDYQVKINEVNTDIQDELLCNIPMTTSQIDASDITLNRAGMSMVVAMSTFCLYINRKKEQNK